MNELHFCVGALILTGFGVFAFFCFTVVHFPEGSLIIQGPWGINVEAQLGKNQEQKALPPKESDEVSKTIQ